MAQTIMERIAAMEAEKASRERRREQVKKENARIQLDHRVMNARAFRDSPLGRRHAAALEILRQGGVDGALLLSYVIWPTPDLEIAMEKVLAEAA